jgi:very-short-patch-repair endonuclease
LKQSSNERNRDVRVPRARAMRHVPTVAERVLRFWNNDVLSNVEGVMETITAAVRTCPPLPTPPRHAAHGGREEEDSCL